MKTTKKIISVLLSLILVFGCAAALVSVRAEGEGGSSGGYEYSVGDIIEFGSYPQTGVETSTELANAAAQAPMTSCNYYSGSGTWSDGQMTAGNYMSYADFDYQGNRYRAVVFSEFRPQATGRQFGQDESYVQTNGYEKNQTYFFKYEPLKWRVIDPRSGIVACVSAIDSQPFNNFCLRNGSYKYGDADLNNYASNYEHSSIRQWLNNDFYNTAFSDEEKSNIFISNNLSCTSSFNGQFSGNPVRDYVFLLSGDDVSNARFGFNSDKSAADEQRVRKATDYAKCQGIYIHPDSGNSYWWLRTPCMSDSADTVGCDSKVGNNITYYTYQGVVPAVGLRSVRTDSFAPEMTVQAENTNYGSPVTVTATLPDDADGEVTFTVDGNESKAAAVSDGTAQASFEDLGIGTHSVSAVFAGDSYYLDTSADTGFEVLSFDCLLTINYLYAGGGEASTPYTDTLAILSSYSVKSPVIEGYEPSLETVSGQMDSAGGKTINVTYTAIRYTATFTAGGETVGTAQFTVESTSLDEPEFPAKPGYDGKWSDYTIAAGDMEIKAEYTAIPYKATFFDADGTPVFEVTYTMDDTSITEPEVPAKEGFEGKWESYELAVGGITVRPVYTQINLCPLDGRDHGQGFFGRVIRFVHTAVWNVFRFLGLNIHFEIT